jgi:hypothetical protein
VKISRAIEAFRAAKRPTGPAAIETAGPAEIGWWPE